MKQESIIKRVVTYLNDQSVDIRIRMMFFLEYASLFACSVGTVCMVLLKQPVKTMIPNIILFVISFVSIYLSHIKKKYDLSTLLMIIGCANIALPWMFFSAGGNHSGMHSWFLFSVAVTCMMSVGKIRILMVAITILEDLVCICIGQFFPDTIIPLVGENADFYDELQSYAVVCICLSAMLIIYIATYDTQGKKLEEQSIELKRLMLTDALTGLYNRHAYYDEINTYKNGKSSDGLVLVAMDVNGLKKINDLQGHSAGDDYICETAKVISESFGEYGHIFRTGGDEFMAILHCSEEEAKGLEKRLNDCVSKLDGSWPDRMAIAFGIVCCDDNPETDITDIEKLADKRMYENKAAYYRRNGIDRRK